MLSAKVLSSFALGSVIVICSCVNKAFVRLANKALLWLFGILNRLCASPCLIMDSFLFSVPRSPERIKTIPHHLHECEKPLKKPFAAAAQSSLPAKKRAKSPILSKILSAYTLLFLICKVFSSVRFRRARLPKKLHRPKPFKANIPSKRTFLHPPLKRTSLQTNAPLKASPVFQGFFEHGRI